MFKVRVIGGGIVYTVYSVRTNDGDIEFLLYRKNKEKWYWYSAANFEPLKE